MRSIFKRRLVSLVAVLILLVSTATGCGGSKGVPDIKDITLDSITGPYTGESVEPAGDETSDGSHSSENSISGDDTDLGDNQQETTAGDGSDGGDQIGSEQNQTNQNQTSQNQTTQTTKNNSTTQATTQEIKHPPGYSTGQSTTVDITLTGEYMSQEIVDTIIKPGMSDFEKAITIHDWLTINLDYDHSYTHYFVYDTLKDRKAVCQGYALTFELMCKQAGLEVKFVVGTAESSPGQSGSHAWNQVKIDGKWYNVDVTWDDPTSANKDFNDHSSNRYDYFLVSDSAFYQDHTAATTNLSICSVDYDTKTIIKYAMTSGVYENAVYAESTADIASAINSAVLANKTDLVIWYYDTTVTDSTMWQPILAGINAAAYPAQTGPSYPPSNGVTKYTLTVTPINEWDDISVATCEPELTALIDLAFENNMETLVVRYEPADSNLNIWSTKYSLLYSYVVYNGGKSKLMTMEMAKLKK